MKESHHPLATNNVSQETCYLWLIRVLFQRQLVVTARLPPIRQICGAWQPPTPATEPGYTPNNPPPHHPICALP